MRRARSEEYDVQTASDVDVIVTPTIPAVHDVVRRQILEAGENAYSEKPLVLTRGHDSGFE